MRNREPRMKVLLTGGSENLGYTLAPMLLDRATYRSFSMLSPSETPALKFGRSGFLRRAEAPYLFARAPMLRILPIVYRS